MNCCLIKRISVNPCKFTPYLIYDQILCQIFILFKAVELMEQNICTKRNLFSLPCSQLLVILRKIVRIVRHV